MQTNPTIQDAAPDSAGDNNLVLGAARSGEEIVPLQRMDMLAARWRAKAAENRREAALTYSLDTKIVARVIADAYDDCADALETEWADSGHIEKALRPADEGGSNGR